MTTEVENNSVEPLTDEQLAEQFPGQDVAHLRSMMDKADGTPAPTEVDSNVDYPAHIPEKFRQGTVEEAYAKMAESYANLEKTVSGKQDASKVADEQTNTNAAEGEGEGAPKTVSMDGILGEFKGDGITEASYKAMEAQGMSREMVDNYAAGQSAIADQLITKSHAVAGGEEKYNALMEWATGNWSPDEIQAYDSIMAKGDPASVSLAITGLAAAMKASGNPVLLTGDSAAQGGNTGASYQSRAEMTTDMKNPLYKTDSAFRAQVAKKLENSNIW